MNITSYQPAFRSYLVGRDVGRCRLHSRELKIIPLFSYRTINQTLMIILV